MLWRGGAKEGGGETRASRARMMWWLMASWEARDAKWARAKATRAEKSGRGDIEGLIGFGFS